MIPKKSNRKNSTDWTDADYLAYWKSKCVITEQGCWLWQGFTHYNGYGGTSYRGKAGRVHRFALQCHRGKPAPADWDVCHTCDNRLCINPLHLFAAPRSVNIEDMRAKHRGNNQKKTHCPRGHEYTPDNTYICKRGWRGCLKCQMIRNRLRSGWTLLEAESLPLVPQGAITARRDFKHRLRNSQSGKSDAR